MLIFQLTSKEYWIIQRRTIQIKVSIQLKQLYKRRNWILNSQGDKKIKGIKNKKNLENNTNSIRGWNYKPDLLKRPMIPLEQESREGMSWEIIWAKTNNINSLDYDPLYY